MNGKVKRFKRSLGLFLFWGSWLLWAVLLLVPLLPDADAATVTVTVTALLVAAELSFAVSLLLLGKPFHHAFKAKIKVLWFRLRGEREGLEPLD